MNIQYNCCFKKTDWKQIYNSLIYKPYLKMRV